MTTAATISPTPTPRERPILFSGRLVRAILDGRKTQTRRIVKPQPRPADDGSELLWPFPKGRTSLTVAEMHVGCPYGARGDRLWVRETWRAMEDPQTLVDGVRFLADGAFVPIEPTEFAVSDWMCAYDNGRHGTNFRPSIHMPRWASRIDLEVTGVRVERLRDISEEDARAEGVEVYSRWHDSGEPKGWLGAETPIKWYDTAREAFESLWDSINYDRGSWESNPWVWVVEFKRVRP